MWRLLPDEGVSSFILDEAVTLCCWQHPPRRPYACPCCARSQPEPWPNPTFSGKLFSSLKKKSLHLFPYPRPLCRTAQMASTVYLITITLQIDISCRRTAQAANLQLRCYRASSFMTGVCCYGFGPVVRRETLCGYTYEALKEQRSRILKDLGQTAAEMKSRAVM